MRRCRTLEHLRDRQRLCGADVGSRMCVWADWPQIQLVATLYDITVLVSQRCRQPHESEQTAQHCFNISLSCVDKLCARTSWYVPLVASRDSVSGCIRAACSIDHKRHHTVTSLLAQTTKSPPIVVMSGQTYVAACRPPNIIYAPPLCQEVHKHDFLLFSKCSRPS